ncbi:MAG TPA: ABC transporter substrate-binding protein [Candidatus Nitrosocosmicus sp.]|jgi:phospholipid transport system substrate-binding protein|nr:ABC transporter substrate-binding protein [Candidatus Nitrosocosmicus sp.]
MSRGIAAMTRAVLFAPLFTLNRPAKVVLEVRRNLPTEMVQKAVEELLGDKAVVARTAENFFDLREMAKKSLGRHWVARSPQERDEFVRLFRGMLSRVWLRTLKTGKRITYTGETVTSTRATVRTTVALERQGQVHVEYHLLPSGNSRWRVHDVLVDRRSLVTGYREYFDRALADSSYQDLIWKLRLKEVEMSPAAESA